VILDSHSCEYEDKSLLGYSTNVVLLEQTDVSGSHLHWNKDFLYNHLLSNTTTLQLLHFKCVYTDTLSCKVNMSTIKFSL
jgi:hypothetical protein